MAKGFPIETNHRFNGPQGTLFLAVNPKAVSKSLSMVWTLVGFELPKLATRVRAPAIAFNIIEWDTRCHGRRFDHEHVRERNVVRDNASAFALSQFFL
jgi:hypothetical protein